MNLKGKNIGFAFTSSFYSLEKVIAELKKISKYKNVKVVPIMSYNCYSLNTKYGKSSEFIDKIKNITGNEIIHSISEVQKLGDNTDILVIAPCTGNTLSKLANNIYDTPITVASKFYLIKNKPIVIAPVSNNGLSSEFENIGKLLDRKNYFFVPFRQTNPITKPHSLSFDPEYLIKTIEFALEKEQISPLLL